MAAPQKELKKTKTCTSASQNSDLFRSSFGCHGRQVYIYAVGSTVQGPIFFITGDSHNDGASDAIKMKIPFMHELDRFVDIFVYSGAMW
jgi:hypothetical protein